MQIVYCYLNKYMGRTMSAYIILILTTSLSILRVLRMESMYLDTQMVCQAAGANIRKFISSVTLRAAKQYVICSIY